MTKNENTPLQFGKGVLCYIEMEELLQIPVSDITVNPYQPRTEFSVEKLTELAESIRENGLIQPVIVRKSQVWGYELLAGERRWRASKIAGLEKIPAIVKELTDQEMMLQAIIENLQRDNLNPVEEAKSYQTLIDKGMTHDEIARSMGKSRPYISNLVRLLNLTPKVLQAVQDNQISQAHARLLVPLADREQERWLENILSETLSVHQLEHLLKPKQRKVTSRKENLFKSDMEEQLKQLLGLPVSIKMKNKESGMIQISFQNQEEFHRFINTLK